MSEKYQDYNTGKILLVAISAAILVGYFVIGNQLAEAQDLGQMGQQAKEKIGGAMEQIVGGNQTANQTGNQSGGALGQLGEQVRNMLGQ
jgi:hypothetical protein